MVAAGGGGVANLGTMRIVNSTFSGNSISAADFAAGAAITSPGASDLSLEHVTIVGNTASAGFVFGDLNGSATVSLSNTLIDGDCTLTTAGSLGGNIESPGDTCMLDDPSDQVNVSESDLMLGPLADNGGPTQTHALLEGSVAIDAGTLDGCLETDQRGELRDAACDVGAYELLRELPEISCEDAVAELVHPKKRDRSWRRGHWRRPVLLVEVAGVETAAGDPARITIQSLRQDEPTRIEREKRERPHPRWGWRRWKRWLWYEWQRKRDLCPDGKLVDANLAALRRERDPRGNGRVYHVGFLASDDETGATCEGSVQVCVPRKGKSGDCVDEGPLFDSTVCEEPEKPQTPGVPATAKRRGKAERR